MVSLATPQGRLPCIPLKTETRIQPTCSDSIHSTVLWTTLRLARVVNSNTQDLVKIRRARYMREDYSKQRARVRCTLSLAENEHLKEWAEETGQSRAEALKEAGLSFIRQKAKTAVCPETTAELVALMRNITTELADMARHSTRTQKVAIFDLYKAERRVLILEDKITAFLNQ